MFNTSLFLDRELELRLRKEQFLHERLSPDSTEPSPWLGRLSRWLGLTPELDRAPRERIENETRAAQIEQELLVPDEHVALLIQDGQAVSLLGSGRHWFPPIAGRLKVRWIHQEHLPEGFWQRTGEDRLALAQRLPYERALLFVDRKLVAVVRPPASARRIATNAPTPRIPSPRIHAQRVPCAAVAEPSDEVQQFSFI